MLLMTFIRLSLSRTRPPKARMSKLRSIGCKNNLSSIIPPHFPLIYYDNIPTVPFLEAVKAFVDFLGNY